MRPARLFASIPFWWTVCLLWAGLLAWNSRHTMNPDGVSYLDMASQAAAGSPGALLNRYWSPGYPAFIAAAFALIHPSRAAEFPLVHALNFAIFILALLCFTWFLNTWVRGKPDASWLAPLGFGLFLWFTTAFTTLRDVSPDLLVAAAVFLAAALCCRVCGDGSNWKQAAALGLVLGLGYYLKTVLLPLGIALLALLLFQRRNGSRRREIVLAFLILLVTAAPLFTLLSIREGRSSIGASGRLNYIWYANQRDLGNYLGWNGSFGASYAALAHPPRKLLDDPLILEFAAPVSGTYPLWYDPAYWWTGARPRFVLHEQLAVIWENLSVYGAALRQMSGLLVGIVLVLLFPGRRAAHRPAEARSSWWLIAWPVAACAGYALIHVEYRFLGAFLVLFWLAVYRLLLPRVDAGARSAIVAAILLTLFVPSALVLRAEWGAADGSDQAAMAGALETAGLRAGDRVALVGPGFTAYYARSAGVRIAAQISDAQSFWRSDAAAFARVTDRLAGTGIKALAAIDRPEQPFAAGWRDIAIPGSHRFSVLPLLCP